MKSVLRMMGAGIGVGAIVIFQWGAAIVGAGAFYIGFRVLSSVAYSAGWGPIGWLLSIVDLFALGGLALAIFAPILVGVGALLSLRRTQQ